MSKLSRREFLKGTATAAGLAAVGVFSRPTWASAADEEMMEGEVYAFDHSENVDETLTCDVVVAGLGASGIMAALGAAGKGANVIAVDVAASIDGTTNVLTSGAWAVESDLEKEYDNYVPLKEAFQYMWKGTHYQSNAKVLRNMLGISGRAINILSEGGMPFNTSFATATEESSYMDKCGHFYGVRGPERGEIFQAMLDKAGVNCIYETQAVALLVEDGMVSGLFCVQEEKKVLIEAKAVILCTGGFLANPEMVAKYYAGAFILPLGNVNCKGYGINMAMAAGAQLGKNFTVSMNEYGGANLKASPAYAFRHNIGENETLRLPILGGLLVDADGNRFMNEGVVCEEAMYTGEPMIRDSVYYGVFDDAFMDKVSTTPLLDMMNTEHMSPTGVSFLTGVTDTDIKDQFDTAVSEGWAFKADTIEELADFFNLPCLPETVAAYNEACETGEDELFYKDAMYLNSVMQPPFYIAQYIPSAWLTMGGIKTDGYCRAIDPANSVISGLYIAGMDADLFSIPYFQSTTANGFCLASGLLAGETAVADMTM